MVGCGKMVVGYGSFKECRGGAECHCLSKVSKYLPANHYSITWDPMTNRFPICKHFPLYLCNGVVWKSIIPAPYLPAFSFENFSI
jgi:hypothetical protein